MENKNKRILITGGTGFLGSYLLRFLIQQGY
ncbi:MAG: NAD-dependent epimerase/dehydratase family protein, partial [Bacteroidota bacterium]